MSFLEKPNNVWFAIAGIVVSFAVSLAVLQGAVKANEKDINSLTTSYDQINRKLDDLTEKINTVTVSQAQIKVDIDYIKRAVIVVQEK